MILICPVRIRFALHEVRFRVPDLLINNSRAEPAHVAPLGPLAALREIISIILDIRQISFPDAAPRVPATSHPGLSSGYSYRRIILSDTHHTLTLPTVNKQTSHDETRRRLMEHIHMMRYSTTSYLGPVVPSVPRDGFSFCPLRRNHYHPSAAPFYGQCSVLMSPWSCSALGSLLYRRYHPGKPHPLNEIGHFTCLCRSR